MKKNLLQRYINKEVKKIMNFSKPKPDKTIKNFDYYHVITSKFSYVPPHKMDREERLKKMKANLNLSFLNNVDKRSLLMNEKVGSDRDGLLFNKMHPINSIDQQVRPNSLDWSTSQHNRRLLDRMVRNKDEFEKNGKKVEELKKTISLKSQELKNQ